MTQRAAVVGSGPNGLTAACRLARAGWEVTVYEAAQTVGGAARSAELFGPGIISDLGASIHPLSAASPAYDSLLGHHDVEWAQPDIPAAHGIDGEPPALLHESLEATAQALGGDGDLWRWLVGPLATNWDEVRQAVLNPPLGRASFTRLRRAAALMQLGSAGSMPASLLMRGFRTTSARALFAGLAAHSTAPLANPLTAAVGLAFGASAHAQGWPAVRGGSRSSSTPWSLSFRATAAKSGPVSASPGSSRGRRSGAAPVSRAGGEWKAQLLTSAAPVSQRGRSTPTSSSWISPLPRCWILRVCPLLRGRAGRCAGGTTGPVW